MEYADLVQAIRENRSSRVDKHLRTLLPRLVRFLRIHMNASMADAEDCAHDALLSCLEAINKNSLRNPDRVLSYLLTTCRNNYLKVKDKREPVYDELPYDRFQEPGQLNLLLDQEKNRILQWCINQLNDEFKKFIQYWFLYPDSEAEHVAGRFGLSVSNTWTRKHRIIKQLKECYEKKSKE